MSSRYLEPLECRRLMASTLADGVLRVDGTKGDDVVTVWEYERDRKVAVRFGSRGKIVWYHLDQIERVIVETGRGNDRVEVRWAGAPCFVYGGRGDDTLRGSDGADYLDGGLGDDALTGDRGDDTLVGGRGDDELHGSAGADHQLAGAGIDEVFTDGAPDVVRDAEEIHHLERHEEIDLAPSNVKRIKLLQDDDAANAFIEFEFPDSSFGLNSVRSQRQGNEVRIEVGATKWLGLSHPTVTLVQRRVALGDLPAGTYTIVVLTRGGEELARQSVLRTQPQRHD